MLITYLGEQANQDECGGKTQDESAETAKNEANHEPEQFHVVLPFFGIGAV